MLYGKMILFFVNPVKDVLLFFRAAAVLPPWYLDDLLRGIRKRAAGKGIRKRWDDLSWRPERDLVCEDDGCWGERRFLTFERPGNRRQIPG